MSQIMWKKLPYSKPLFILFRAENGYRVHITDFITIWSVFYRENELLNVLKESNDDLEIESDNQLLQLGCQMLSEPKNLRKLRLTFEYRTLKVSMSMSCGFPLYLDVKLTEGSREMFAKGVTQPLLKIVYDLRTSENELRLLLIKKDKEIEEYKNETDVRLARYLKTGTFRDEEHMGKHSLYQSHFGALEESKCLLDKIIDEKTSDDESPVTVKQENVQEDEPRLKVEPESQPTTKEEPDAPVTVTETPSHSKTVNKEIKRGWESSSPKKKLRKLLL